MWSCGKVEVTEEEYHIFREAVEELFRLAQGGISPPTYQINKNQEGNIIMINCGWKETWSTVREPKKQMGNIGRRRRK